MFYNHQDCIGKFVNILIKLQIGWIQFPQCNCVPSIEWARRHAYQRQEESWLEEAVATWGNRTDV